MSIQKRKVLGFRTSVQVPADVEKLIEAYRVRMAKQEGFKPSRSEAISTIVRTFFERDGNASQAAG